MAFPQRYPDVPPLVLFTSDVFHPLITPLTTYTYTTGSSAADPVSATDEDRLLPGGFSLRHGFPRWFEREEKTNPSEPMFPDIKVDDDDVCCSDEHMSSPTPKPKTLRAFHIPPPKDNEESTDVEDLSPSIIAILEYLKNVFEDETFLDDLPLDAAGNPGAWHAWRAHRRKGRPAAVKNSDTPQPSTPHRRTDSSGKAKPANDWNWDGVWAERVKRGVNGSLSEAMLYGGVDGDDLVRRTASGLYEIMLMFYRYISWTWMRRRLTVCETNSRSFAEWKRNKWKHEKCSSEHYGNKYLC